MKPVKLYMVAHCQGDDEYLSDDKVGAHSWREATMKDLTIEALASYLDQDAENINAHDYCGAHRRLAALLHQMIGHTRTWKVLWKLVEYRGLHGMVGVCGRGDPDAVADELGLPRNDGEEWKLK